MKELDGPMIRVQVEDEARAEEDVPRVRHIGDAGVSEGADVDGVEVPLEHLVGSLGEGYSGFEVALGAEVELLDRETGAGHVSERGQYRESFPGYVDSDSVSGDDGDAFLFHRERVAQRMLRPWRRLERGRKRQIHFPAHVLEE